MTDVIAALNPEIVELTVEEPFIAPVTLNPEKVFVPAKV